MPGPIQRNAVVNYFGMPDRSEGSVNEPRKREELPLRFNQKWVYRRPKNDAAGAAERAIYWRRYDYVGSLMRHSAGGDWKPDTRLATSLPDGRNDKQ